MFFFRSAYYRNRRFVAFAGIVFVFIATLALAQQPTPAPASGKSGSSPIGTGSANPNTPQAAHPPAPETQVPGIDSKTGTPLYETIQEDWSSLVVGTSKLESDRPLVAPTEEQATFTRTLVRVQWRPGDPMDLWILLPKGVKKPPIILYLYGYDQDTGRFKNDRWAERVTTGGVAAVGFVSALSGHRFHDRPLKQWFVSELQESVGSTVHDVKFILDYLAERGDVDMNRVGMFGEGSGGTIAILSAAADSRIKAVDTLEPWGDWPEFLAKSAVVAQDPDHADYVKPDFLKRVAPLDPVKWLPELKVPVRIQQVRQGDSTPMEVKEAVASAAPKKASIMRFETDSDMSDHEGGGRLFDWIKEQLLEPANAGGGNTSVADGKTVQPQANGSPSSQR
jgi:hypothetical protein